MKYFTNKTLQRRILASVLAFGVWGVAAVAGATTYGEHTIISKSKFPVEGKDYVNYALKGSNGSTYVNFRLVTAAGINNKRVYSTEGYFKDGDNEAKLEDGETPRSATKDDVNALANAQSYLEKITGMPTGAVPNVVVLASTESDNLDAGCLSEDNDYGYTYLSSYYIPELQDKELSKVENVAAMITVNSFEKTDGPLTVLLENGAEPNNTVTLMHEYFHGLGISGGGNSLATVLDKDGNKITGKHLQGVDEDAFSRLVYDIYDQPLNFATYKVSVKPEAGEEEEEPEEASIALVKSVELGKKDKTTPEKGINYVYSEDSTEANGDESFAGLYLRGKNIDAVLKGAKIAWPNGVELDAVPGIPLNCWEDSGTGEYSLEVSHLELQNSLMSHQSYRNWGVLMEAELAVLQDIGYNVNRKAFYGSSIYASGTEEDTNTVVNKNPYYELTTNGKSYQKGVPSTVANGIGLHIYGSYNDVIQAADLLTKGDYALGARIDGIYNEFTVDKGVTVAGNGKNGSGIAVSWGMGHELNINGIVEATGEGGKALRLDFGDNMLGNDKSYIGSYLVLMQEDEEEGTRNNVNNNLFASPLVNNINVNGSIKGNEAAIYMSPNAFVKNINIMSGAEISGDIINEWKHVTTDQVSDPSNVELEYNPENKKNVKNLTLNEYCPNLVTAINVSVGQGNVFNYKDNITGSDNTKLNIVNGEMAFKGDADVVSISISQGATLSGGASLTVHDMTSKLADGYSDPASGYVFNAGTLMAGVGTEISSIDIEGNLAQTETGTLAAKFGSDGYCGGVDVSGIANVYGSFALVPAQGYFEADKEYQVTALTAGTYKGQYTASLDKSNEELSKLSPTLKVMTIKDATTKEEFIDDNTVATADGQGKFIITVDRKEDAYSSLAEDETTSELGQVLDANAAGADTDWKKLYAALDFSGGDGSGVRNGLQQLSGNVYGSAALNSLDIHRTLNNMLMSFDTNGYSNGAEVLGNLEDDAIVRHKAVVPFTKYTSQSSFTAHNTGVYGFADKMGKDGLMIGYHAAVNHSSLSGKANGSIKGDGVYLGTQLRYMPAKWGKVNAFGVARLAVEQERAHRRTVIGSWSGTTDDDYTSWSGSAKAGVEYGTKLKGFGALDYAFVHQPDISESGAVNRLKIDSKDYNSLRTQLGLKYTTSKKQLDKDSDYSTFLLSAWNHELLSKAGDQTLRFGTLEGGWSSRVKEHGRDSMTLGAGFTFHTPKKLDVTLMVGSDVYRKDGHSTYGKLGAEWKF